MKTVKENSNEARFADYRLCIGHDNNYNMPSKHMDMIFTEAAKLDKPIHCFTVINDDTHEVLVLGTTQEKIDKEFPGLNVNKTEWLENIQAAEKKVWQDAIDGNVFYMCVQQWDANERMFVDIDSMYNLYGTDDVQANIPELYCIGKVTAIVDATGQFNELDLTAK